MVATNWIMEAVFDAADDTLKVKKESGAKRSGTRGPKPFCGVKHLIMFSSNPWGKSRLV